MSVSASCPVCGEFFEAVLQSRFERHVNLCLDGVPDNEPLHCAVVGSTSSRAPRRLLPNPESVISLNDGDESPISQRAATTPPPLTSIHVKSNPESHESAGTSALPQRTASMGTDLASPHGSSDFYTSISESVAHLHQMLPNFPPALVEEILIATGGDRDVAAQLLLELQDDETHPKPRAMHHSVSLQNFGITTQLSRDRTVSPTPPPRTTSKDVSDVVVVTPSVRSVAVPEVVSSPVELVVYDLQPSSSFAKKIGLGAYHSGVVVYGHEFSFGGSRNLKRDAGRPGIWATRRLYVTAPIVKKRLVLGRTYFTPTEIKDVVKEWGRTNWRVDDYHLLSNNCNHFAEAFLQKLAEKSVLLPMCAMGTTGESGTPVQASVGRSVSPPPATPKSQQVNIPSGATPLPRFPCASPTTSSSADGDGVFPASAPSFPLPVEEKRKVLEAFRLPAWVNRAAKLGDAVIPEFLFQKILEKLLPPVPEEEDDSDGNTPKLPPKKSSVASSS